MDENSRIDENEQTMSRSVRPTQPSASALLVCLCVCVCVCVPRATRSPPTPFQTPYPPNRRVAGWHLGHLGSRGGEGRWFWWEAGVTREKITARPTRAPARFDGNTRSSQVSGVALAYLCLPACLPSCQTYLPPCLLPPPPRVSCSLPTISWNSRLAVGSRGGRKEGRSGPRGFTLAAESGGAPRRLGAGGTGHWGLCRTW